MFSPNYNNTAAAFAVSNGNSSTTACTTNINNSTSSTVSSTFESGIGINVATNIGAPDNYVGFLSTNMAINPFDVYKQQAYTSSDLAHAPSLTASTSSSSFNSQTDLYQIHHHNQLQPVPQYLEHNVIQESVFVQPYPFKENIPFKLNIFQQHQQQQQQAQLNQIQQEQVQPPPNHQIQHVIQKRPLISPVVVAHAAPSNSQDNQVSTPPTSPTLYQNNGFYQNNQSQNMNNVNISSQMQDLQSYGFEDNTQHDGFFNTDIFSIGDATTAAAAAAAATVASISGPTSKIINSINNNTSSKKYGNTMFHPSIIIPNTPISEGDIENSPKYTTTTNGANSSKSPNVVLETQIKPHLPHQQSTPLIYTRTGSSSNKDNKNDSHSDPTSPMDVNTALALATKAYSKHLSNPQLYHNTAEDSTSEEYDDEDEEEEDDRVFNQNQRPFSPRHHSMPDYKLESDLNHIQYGGYHGHFNQRTIDSGKNFKQMVYQLFAPAQIKDIKLIEPQLKCFRNHCNTSFDNYEDYINHCYFQNNDLNFVEIRNFKCPVNECPMNLIGYEKKANLRHHVVIEHFQRGKVVDTCEPYSLALKEIIYVCDHHDCGKGFYRKDSLTRHLKLVHQNSSSLFNQKKRQGSDGVSTKKRRSRS